MQDVYEMCPFCATENEFKDVPDNIMIMTCSGCGRPIVLCDKCQDHSKCANCKWDRKCDTLRRKWESDQIGKIVYWHDPDNDECSDYAKITGFFDGVYQLSVIRCTIDGYSVDEGTIEAFDEEVEQLDEDRQIEVLIGHFKFGYGWKK